jgi:hypothetical protein
VRLCVAACEMGLIKPLVEAIGGNVWRLGCRDVVGTYPSRTDATSGHDYYASL